MVKTGSKGLIRAKEIYQDRYALLKEMTDKGRQAMGYMCLYPVTEVMTALDLVPFRIFGDMREPTDKADTMLPTRICPFIRSCLDLGIKGKYGLLSGIVMSHVCDAGQKSLVLWRTYVDMPYTYFLDTPHSRHKAALQQEKDLINGFAKSLESLTGRKLTSDKLKTAVRLHNEQRALVRQLYDLRKPDPPLISGTETLQVIVAVMSLPVEDGNELLKQVIEEIQKRKDGPVKKGARLLVWGSIVDDQSLIQMIESLDANVVMDDMCVGSRAYFDNVPVTPDPLDGLARHYLIDIKCPRTFVENVTDAKQESYKDYQDRRFSYIRDYVRDWKANGAILEAMSYCDIHAYEVPDLKSYLTDLGISSIYLEPAYNEAIFQPMRMRIQGLLEILH